MNNIKQINRNDYMSYLKPKDAILDEIYLNQALYERTIMFIDEFNRETVHKAIYFMERIERQDDVDNIPMKDRKPIKIILSSYGGICYDYLAWISVVERLVDRGYQIHTHCQSISMSCGIMQLMIGTHRTMARHGYVMLHQISTGSYGTVQDMKESQDHAEHMWNKFKQIVMKYTKITDTQLEDMRMRKLDWYMDSTEALRLGVIDAVV